MLYLACKNCRTRISNFVDFSGQQWSWYDYGNLAEEDFVETSKYFKDEEGNYILNIADKRNLTNHPDIRRFTGCCGPSTEGEANLLCQCKQEIAREISDCITPYYIKVLKASVIEVNDKWNLFPILQRIESKKYMTLEQIEHIVNLQQYGQVKQAVEWLKESLPVEGLQALKEELNTLPNIG